MAAETSLRIGDEYLGVKSPKMSGQFVENVKEWAGKTSGAYDLMKSINKIAELNGNRFVASQTGAYLAGTSVPYLLFAATALHQSLAEVKEGKNEKRPLTTGLTILRQTFDLGKAISFTTALFRKSPKQFLNAGQVLIACSEATELTSQAFRLKHSTVLLKCSESNPVVNRAVRNDCYNAMLKIGKGIAAFVAAIFACLAFITGAAVVSTTLALTVALTSAILSIFAYYHENYWCDVNLDLKYKPVQIL